MQTVISTCLSSWRRITHEPQRVKHPISAIYCEDATVEKCLFPHKLLICNRQLREWKQQDEKVRVNSDDEHGFLK